MNISSFLSINIPCDDALAWTKRRLSQAGMHVVQTFDLHDVRSGPRDCPCSNHGSDECDCQMVVLLIYGKAPEPVTLFLHGNHGQTWISIADAPRQKTDEKLYSEIRQVLDTKTPITVSQGG